MERYRRFPKLLLLVGLAIGLNLAGRWLADMFDFQVFPRHESVLQMMVLGAVGGYILLMAIPFMPGIEVGLALLVILGGGGALLIYLSTVFALSVSYWLGRLMPEQSLSRILAWLHFDRAAGLVARVESLPPNERVSQIYAMVPAGVLPILVRHRFLAVAVLLNLPGNALIGGGGGIGMLMGMSRLIPFYQYLLVVALAVAPVPLTFYLTGWYAGV